MWIDVNDQLPSLGQDILASDGDVVEAGFYSTYRDPWIDFSFPVTHWMPLPATPNSDTAESPSHSAEQAQPAIARLVFQYCDRFNKGLFVRTELNDFARWAKQQQAGAQ